MIFQKLGQSEKRSTILESPTGSGKTVSVLFHAVSKYPDRRVVFLTRTNSQGENLLREARALGLEKVMTFFGRGVDVSLQETGVRDVTGHSRRAE
jgi:Rad3-related DNA helicases